MQLGCQIRVLGVLNQILSPIPRFEHSRSCSYTHPMRVLFTFSLVMLSTAAIAAESAPDNMFRADLSNPDLALAVSHFEETCMPFILHKSEVTRDLNKQHMSKQIENLGYDLISSEEKSERVVIAPARAPWKPPAQVRSNNSVGQFTVFNGISSQVVEATQTIVEQTGEISGPLMIPALYRTLTRDIETYSFNAEDRVSTILVWNYASQDHPGKSCEIKVSDPALTQNEFKAAFIEKDRDWLPKNNSWLQCVREGEDQYRFTAHYEKDVLSLHVIRNDFHAPDICINWLSARPALP